MAKHSIPADIVERAIIKLSDKNYTSGASHQVAPSTATVKRKKLRCSEFEYQDTHGSTMITEVSLAEPERQRSGF